MNRALQISLLALILISAGCLHSVSDTTPDSHPYELEITYINDTITEGNTLHINTKTTYHGNISQASYQVILVAQEENGNLTSPSELGDGGPLNSGENETLYNSIDISNGTNGTYTVHLYAESRQHHPLNKSIQNITGKPYHDQATVEILRQVNGSTQVAAPQYAWENPGLWWQQQRAKIIAVLLILLVLAGAGFYIYRKRDEEAEFKIEEFNLADISTVFSNNAGNDHVEEEQEEDGIEVLLEEEDFENDVYRCWMELMNEVSIPNPRAKTSQEIADAAIEEGMDEEAVRELTDLYEEVLFGDKEVTTEEESKARNAIEKIKAKTQT